jgi:hypothetical protein
VLLLLLDEEEDENVADAIADKERAFRRAWCASIFFSFFFLFCEVIQVCSFAGKNRREEAKREGRRRVARTVLYYYY